MCAVIAIVPVGWRQAHSWCAGRHVHNGSGVGSRQLDQLQRAGDCRGGSIARSMPATPMPQAVALCRGSACLARFSSGVISPYSGGLAMACGGTSPPVLHRAGKNRLMAGFFIEMIVSLRRCQVSEACRILRNSVCDIFGIRLCGTRLFSDRLKTSKAPFLMTDLVINLKLGSMFLCQ